MSDDRSINENGLWDPFGSLGPIRSRTIWFVIALVLSIHSGARFIRNVLYPMPTSGQNEIFVPDFFQDYASARNYHEKLPVYTDHNITAMLYLDTRLKGGDEYFSFKVNAHPPSSILIFLPFGKLDFYRAYAIWNLFGMILFVVSIILLLRELNVKANIWIISPMVVAILAGNTVCEVVRLGQLGFILLFLFVLIWIADRSRMWTTAGFLLAIAISIKLFPAFLMIYFAAKRRWSALISCLVSIVAIASVTAMIFGISTYREYFINVFPRFYWFKNAWFNVSISGYFGRLLDAAPSIERHFFITEPLFYSPTTAYILSSFFSMITISIYLYSSMFCETGNNKDLSFGLSLIVMILVSPIAWDHYLVILTIPIIQAFVMINKNRSLCKLILICVFILWCISPSILSSPFIGLYDAATPILSATVLSTHFYVLYLLYITFLVKFYYHT